MHDHGSNTSEERECHSFHAEDSILSKEFRCPELRIFHCDQIHVTNGILRLVNPTYRVVTLLIDFFKVIIVIVHMTKSTIMFMTYIIMMTGLYCKSGGQRRSV